ncbi:protease HtpX [Buchnera aphidicola]|uniref:protease HtpX n=1 Tax=Buchnera aphidicola TaxID=9 RepID=UPI0031B80A10
MIRIILFLLTNLSVIFILNIFLKIIGINIGKIYFITIISSILGFSSSLISLLLSKWIALKTINGKIIKTPKNNFENWILNTIKKQAKKVNIKIPQIAIYKSLDINAFATGPSKNNSLIAISYGLIKNMNKEEIEAVLAHEISHISNGDMVTMTLIQGVLNTIVILFSKIITQIFSNNLFNNNKEENINIKENSFLYYIISSFLEFTLGILASIIIMWFSRYREFYADSGSAKIVGCNKMISALKTLQIHHEPKELNNSISNFCINGKSKKIFNLFLSHPSLKKRISALYKKKYF